MTPAMSTPASVEAAARAAAREIARAQNDKADRGHSVAVTCEEGARLGYLRGHSDAWPTAYADGHEDGYKRGRAELGEELSKRARRNARLAFAALTVVLFVWVYLNENAREVLAWLVTW